MSGGGALFAVGVSCFLYSSFPFLLLSLHCVCARADTAALLSLSHPQNTSRFMRTGGMVKSRRRRRWRRKALPLAFYCGCLSLSTSLLF